jgi:hypothetical protein
MAESEASWMDDKETTSSPTGTSPEVRHEPQWTDNVVPPSHKGRTLIVCFDGTGDKFDADVRLLTSRRSLPETDNGP